MVKKKKKTMKKAISLVIIAIVFSIAHFIISFNGSKINFIEECSSYYGVFIALLIVIFLLSIFYLVKSDSKFYRNFVFFIVIFLLLVWIMMDLVAFSRGFVFACF